MTEPISHPDGDCHPRVPSSKIGWADLQHRLLGTVPGESDGEPLPKLADSAAATWRTIADQLGTEQIEKLVATESRGVPPRDLLEEAEFFGRDNLGTKLYFGHLPPPAGAVNVGTAGKTMEGTWIRKFRGTKRQVTETDEIRIEIQGTQYPDGSIERGLEIVYQDQNDPNDIDLLFLDSIDTRAFGTALIDAADAIDRLTRQDGHST